MNLLNDPIEHAHGDHDLQTGDDELMLDLTRLIERVASNDHPTRFQEGIEGEEEMEMLWNKAQ